MRAAKASRGPMEADAWVGEVADPAAEDQLSVRRVYGHRWSASCGRAPTAHGSGPAGSGRS
jgi:hypothetical protein